VSQPVVGWLFSEAKLGEVEHGVAPFFIQIRYIVSFFGKWLKINRDLIIQLIQDK